MNYLLLVFVSLIITPVAYLIGYRLRQVIPERKRLSVGFMLPVIVLIVIGIIDFLFFQSPKITQTGIGTAIAVGFPMGLAGPPFTKNEKIM
ncbi:hypothetical protein ciss_12350 [Carboxydothermus islandicus]|uniref:Uncharacterized protein n=1 Tax=Carboxydothermus islandicus TaxID=661089 RepID=A0A1L8D296_9THEO|nr:hypothetical protein [Carboxydothermus islandicus]GAV25302.1 hypothetical protein ciss_12350 [Carboxydothermus islandicus]